MITSWRESIAGLRAHLYFSFLSYWMVLMWVSWWREGVTTEMNCLRSERDREERALLLLSVENLGEGCTARVSEEELI